ncbi:MAG: FecR domain-containing protein [Chitinophagaceae bacterium]|nr:FecR domain-containing protein [Chitinophagaceae bacterium]
MSVAEIADILLKHLQGTLSEEEQLKLRQWLEGSAQRRQYFDELNDEEQLRAHLLMFLPEQEKETEQAILAKINLLKEAAEPARRVHFLRTGWLRYAAAILVILGIATWLLIPSKDDKRTARQVPASQLHDIAPGKTGAVLTLADGRQIVLDSAGNGVIATQSGKEVVLENGKLLYDPSAKTNGQELFNTMSTPKGRQFQVVLPDGTKVWLNAASSIRYPVEFSDKERKVYISGEAYFDVAKDAARPFLVNADNRADIEVLGTQFNVNAYDNEKLISTTLVNGTVRVETVALEPATIAGSGDVILKPGQQAQIANKVNKRSAGRSSAITVLDGVDIDKITAWKNGLFNFDEATIEDVMRQLERWYDIEVVYENGIPNITFWGEMSRQIPLKDLLEILQKTEVSYRIEEGRKLVVLNK